MASRKTYLPKWLRDKYEEGKNFPEIKQRLEDITDFPVLIECVWIISNQDYQERIWVKHETVDVVDSYMDTMMNFQEDAEAVLNGRDAGKVKMTDKQYEMLKKLCDMISAFEDDAETPDDLGYSINDKAIVNDMKWPKIRKYAQKVYSEITGESC